ncbi:tyrosine-type recombinase/integrase [uncultured Piscinibacter sp.]|uniref:tyrosine-type recombinase/integrase n=1 Tax=uncultured Piscinibacter sp. TaxID=1131835 RepID=UPI00260B21D5|nr:tyrosine-type recombinase/integrase [uncultured Piscinibacter sp.]
MSPASLLKDAGILCYPDSVDVDHLRFNRQARRRANRFAAFQMQVLGATSKPGTYAARLIALDLVRPTELGAALSAEPYRLQALACIDWKADGGPRTDRRALCCFTTLALAGRAPSVDEERAAMLALLAALPEYRAIAEEKRLLELECDLACWAAQRLPRPLWAHVTGLRPMSALPRHQIALGNVDGVPLVALDERSASRRAEAADMLDTAVAAGRPATTPLLVELATEVFKTKRGETQAETLDRWERELLALRARVEAGDVSSAIVIAWQLDLVQSGTLTEVDAALETRARYARIASGSLWRILATLPPDPRQWDPDTLGAGYLAAMADPTCKDARKLGAAISSFQGFVQEVFGLPALPLGLHKFIPASAPRAQWIPESAVRRAIRWMDEDERGDPRLKDICSLMILLAYFAPFRLAELRWLRLKNIARLPDGTIEIEVTPRRGVAKLKTAAATRRVLISDAATIERLTALEQAREEEGAASDALLFAGAGDDATPYRAHAVHVTLLRVLKCATGDPAMTFHALRHTHVSNAMELLLSTSSICNGSRLAQLADWTGHEVAVTTIEFYAHRFELALRTQIDAALRECALTNADGARSLGMKANWLTVGAKRKGLSLSDHVWHSAGQQAVAAIAQLPSAAHGLELQEPPAPSFAGSLTRNFTIFDCLRTLRLLGKADTSVLLHRMHLAESNLTAIDRAADQVLAAIYASRGRLPPNGVSGALAVMRHLSIQLDRADQHRYEVLRQALALPQEASVAADAATAWTKSWWNAELSADPPERLVPLLAFLYSLGITSSSLLLTYEDDGTDPDGVRSLLASASAIAVAVFHDHLPNKPLPHQRRGRERAFLVWPSRADAPEAGRSNAGFDALMFAVAIWARPEVQEWN